MTSRLMHVGHLHSSRHAPSMHTNVISCTPMSRHSTLHICKYCQSKSAQRMHMPRVQARNARSPALVVEQLERECDPQRKDQHKAGQDGNDFAQEVMPVPKVLEQEVPDRLV